MCLYHTQTFLRRPQAVHLRCRATGTDSYTIPLLRGAFRLLRNPQERASFFTTTTCAAVEVTVIRSNMWFKSWGPREHLPFFRSSGEKHATRLLHTERDNASAAPCTYIPWTSHSSQLIPVHLLFTGIAIFIANSLQTEVIGLETPF